MEQTITATRGVDSSEGYLLPNDLAQLKEARSEKLQKDNIYSHAKHIAIDLMLATDGKEITEDHINALFFRGYLDYQARDILDNSYFDGLEDFNNDVRASFLRKLERKKQREVEWKAEISSAKLPKLLFKQVDFVAIEGRSAHKKNADGSYNLAKDVGTIREEEVDDDIKLNRYLKFKLAKELIDQVRSDVDEHRILGIALGIFLDKDGVEGKKISSFQSEVHKASNNQISQSDVELTIEANRIYDYVHHERRKQFLEEMIKAANDPIIISVRSRDKQVLYRLETSELYMDIQRKRILVGKTAVNQVLNGGIKPDRIKPISEMLSSEYVYLKPGKKINHEPLTRPNLINYGRMLLRLTGRVNREILTKSSQLGLGPTPYTIKTCEEGFENLYDFYTEIGMTHQSKPGLYDNWKVEDFVNHITRVAAEEGGVVTEDRLRERIKKDGKVEPSPLLIRAKTGMGFNEIREAAGLNPHNKKLDREACIAAGVNFFLNTGRLPTVSDIRKVSDTRNSPELPSSFPISKYCGGIKAFQKLVVDRIKETSELVA